MPNPANSRDRVLRIKHEVAIGLYRRPSPQQIAEAMLRYCEAIPRRTPTPSSYRSCLFPTLRTEPLRHPCRNPATHF